MDVAWHFEPARELGGDLYDFLSPEPNSSSSPSATCRARACRRRSTASFAGEMVRGRTFRARLERSAAPGAMLTAINRILHERQLEEYYCTLCYAHVRLAQHT